MSVYTGESRGELLAWLNDLLAPQQTTKLEQCGTGSIYCQIIDSIFRDLPMSKVKYNARMEYEYLDNFKILQKAFKTHQIDKPIPVDKLVKCKMQDNLEFLQWMKKFWDANGRGDGYDAVGRAGSMAPPVPTSSSSRQAHAPPPRTQARAPTATSRAASSASAAHVQSLNAQVQEMQIHCESLERERDFYFDKLRQIEVIVQERTAVDGVETSEKDVLAKIQEILYTTEDGFETPANGMENLNLGDEEEPSHPDEEETF